ALLVIEIFEKGLGVLLTNLRRRAADEQKSIPAIVEDRHRPPTLCLGFCLDEHRIDPPWPRGEELGIAIVTTLPAQLGDNLAKTAGTVKKKMSSKSRNHSSF